MLKKNKKQQQLKEYISDTRSCMELLKSLDAP